MGNQWPNPFAQFLTRANSAFGKIEPEHEVTSDIGLLQRFVKISEERRFVFDIFDRIEALAMSFDRLHELCEVHLDLEGKRGALISDQRVVAPQRTIFEIPDELCRELNRCQREARALVAFSYYELSTLVTLLRCWLTPSPNSQLEYLVGVRNKLLAHPRRDGFIKNSASTSTIGSMLHAHLVGAQGWIPSLRDWYLKELEAAGGKLDDNAGMQANIALLRSSRRIKDFTPAEILQLKSYMIPEPDPLESACEMAVLLEDKFLPEIERVCSQRIK